MAFKGPSLSLLPIRCRPRSQCTARSRPSFRGQTSSYHTTRRTVVAELDAPEKTQWRPFVQVATALLFTSALLYAHQTTSNPVHLDGPPVQSTSLAEVDEVTKRRQPLTRYSPMRLRMEALIQEHQNRIVFALENIDGKKFRRDEWNRPHGGGGVSCVLQDGNIFEKAGVNTSVVYGELPRSAIEKMRADHKSFVDPDVDKLSFFAAGISLVLHPHNPMAPTVHLNYRYFETSDPRDPVNATGQAEQNWWFGGGTDLTPSYLFEEDATHFHKTLKQACDKHDKAYYPRFKKWCDDYFRIPHRGECRGVGGIFFDDLDASEQPSSKNPREDIFQFCVTGLEAFLPSYVPLLRRRMDMPYLPQHKEWQQLRRGRYVEFNLVNDRGTSFGLRTPGARVESILMSLPRTAKWEYMNPVCGTGVEEKVEDESDSTAQEERKVMEVLRTPRSWV